MHWEELSHAIASLLTLYLPTFAPAPLYCAVSQQENLTKYDAYCAGQ